MARSVAVPLGYMVMFLALTGGAESAYAKAWPLSCVGPLTVRINDQSNLIAVTFRNPGRAGGQAFENLSQGECSWPDRALSGKETSCAVVTNRTSDGKTVYEMPWDTSNQKVVVEQTLNADGTVTLRAKGDGWYQRLLNLKTPGKKSRIYIDGWDGCGKITDIVPVD